MENKPYTMVDFLSDDNCIVIDGNPVPYPVFDCLYEADITSYEKPSGSNGEAYYIGKFNGMLYLAAKLCHVPVADLRGVYFNLYGKMRSKSKEDK